MSKINLGIQKIGSVKATGKSARSAWDKATTKTRAFLKNSFDGLKLQENLKKDVVDIEKSSVVLDIATLHKEIISMQIPYLRILDSRTFSGALLEDSPEKLQKLKELGIATIVDFREEAGSVYKDLCNKEGLEYFNFPLKHTSKFTTNSGVNNEFVENLKKFFEIYNNGNAYMHCKWGIDRTNIGIMLNYLLNPIPHISPEIIAWNGDSAKSIINKGRKLIENLYKNMAPAQKEEIGITDNWQEIIKKRVRRLIEKNKN